MLISIDLAALAAVCGGEAVNTEQTKTGRVDATVTRTNLGYCLDNVKQKADEQNRYLGGYGPVDRSSSGAQQLRDSITQCFGPPPAAKTDPP